MANSALVGGRVGVVAALGAGLGMGAGAAGIPPEVDLGALDGAIGFRLEGTGVLAYTGNSVAAAGDVNGDGIGDIVIGALNADPGGRPGAGITYVVFGRRGGFPSVVDLASLDGADGFRLHGEGAGDLSGYSVRAAGDINGDGTGDVIVGAPIADPGGAAARGSSYVVFGRRGGFPAVIELAALDGTTGVRLDGADTNDFSGVSANGAGDVNGDGVDDAIVGAFGAGGQGAAYVVFGRRGAFPAVIDLGTLDGSTGFRLAGGPGDERVGDAVAGAGDINGDGVADVVVGATYASDGGPNAGAAYVVFGRREGFPAIVLLSNLDGATGFRVDGAQAYGGGGAAVSGGGDVNGDGVDDVVVGASRVDVEGRVDAGESYVVFGRRDGFPAVIGVGALDGVTGFTLEGFDAGGTIGRSVGGGGDVNGDGRADLLVGGPGAGGVGRDRAGETHVLFGGRSFPARVNVVASNVIGSRLDGARAEDASGFSGAFAGDVNGDGVTDVVVGARRADPRGVNRAGEAYVVFGRRSDAACAADFNADGVVDSDDFFDFLNAFFAGCGG